MRVITRKGMAAEAAESWRKQYQFRGGWEYYGGDKEATYDALLALGANPDPDAVDKAIGNKHWTSCHCDECGKDVEAVIEVGQEPDYESSTAQLCLTCIYDAYRAMLANNGIPLAPRYDLNA